MSSISANMHQVSCIRITPVSHEFRPNIFFRWQEVEFLDAEGKVFATFSVHPADSVAIPQVLLAEKESQHPLAKPDLQPQSVSTPLDPFELP